MAGEKYSDWQILRIRRALRGFHKHHRFLDEDIGLADASDGEGETHISWRDAKWEDVAAAIYEYTSVQIEFERIRQFVEGVPGKQGQRRYPVPKPETLAAMVHFLTHEDIDLLSKNELAEYVPSLQAPLRLLEFLDEQPGAERMLPPAEVKGIYQTRFLDGEYIVIRELALLKPSEDGMLEIAEIDEFYERDGAFPEVEDTFYGLEAKLDRRTFSKGWGVITPEDNMLFFLKNQENGRNRYYFSLALGEQLWSEGVLEELVLYDHSYPVLLPGSPRMRSVTLRKVRQGMEPHVLHFKRTSDEVGGEKFSALINV
jgi:hypothetical protein